FFRSIGSTVGVATFGSIMLTRYHHEFAASMPAHVPPGLLTYFGNPLLLMQMRPQIEASVAQTPGGAELLQTAFAAVRPSLELAHMAASARDTYQQRKGQIIPTLIAIVVIAAAVGGFFAWRSRAEARAHTMLAEAMVVDEARVGPPPATGQPAAGLSFPTERE